MQTLRCTKPSVVDETRSSITRAMRRPRRWRGARLRRFLWAYPRDGRSRTAPRPIARRVVSSRRLSTRVRQLDLEMRAHHRARSRVGRGSARWVPVCPPSRRPQVRHLESRPSRRVPRHGKTAAAESRLARRARAPGAAGRLAITAQQRPMADCGGRLARKARAPDARPRAWRSLVMRRAHRYDDLGRFWLSGAPDQGPELPNLTPFMRQRHSLADFRPSACQTSSYPFARRMSVAMNYHPGHQSR